MLTRRAIILNGHEAALVDDGQSITAEYTQGQSLIDLCPSDEAWQDYWLALIGWAHAETGVDLADLDAAQHVRGTDPYLWYRYPTAQDPDDHPASRAI